MARLVSPGPSRDLHVLAANVCIRYKTTTPLAAYSFRKHTLLALSRRFLLPTVFMYGFREAVRPCWPSSYKMAPADAYSASVDTTTMASLVKRPLALAVCNIG